MNNYEYILAGAPDFKADTRSGIDPDETIGEILSMLSDSDRRQAELLLRGFDPEEMTAEFYAEAGKSGNRFIREFFDFDRNCRNVRTEFINKAFNRDPELGQICPDEEFEAKSEVESILSGTDILARERNLDNLLWEKADSICQFSVLNLDLVLGLIAKLKIVGRWIKLDPATGHEMFGRLVSELRNNTNIDK